MLRLVRWGSLGVLVLVAVIAGSSMVFAATDPTLKSAHYQFEESDLGGGGLGTASSSNYQSVLSTQDAAIGSASSSNYQAEGGSQTTADPALTVTINSGGGNFGSFSATAPATATSTFSVSDYTSYGYIVEIVGKPPTNGAHTIAAMSTPGSSVPGTEQFGINLVKNTNFCGSGCDVGADPNYGQFGATTAGPTTNYKTANTFYYSDGDTIIESPKSSGVITYTITYLVNVDNLTPGGQYTTDQSLICIATY